jgi:hypothetical protein
MTPLGDLLSVAGAVFFVRWQGLGTAMRTPGICERIPWVAVPAVQPPATARAKTFGSVAGLKPNTRPEAARPAPR